MITHNRNKIAHKKILAIHNSYWYHLKAWVFGYISITAYVDLTLTNKKLIAGQLLGLMCFSRPIMFVTWKLQFFFIKTLAPSCRQFNYLSRKHHL